jgi:biotin carboxylase
MFRHCNSRVGHHGFNQFRRNVGNRTTRGVVSVKPLLDSTQTPSLGSSKGICSTHPFHLANQNPQPYSTVSFNGQGFPNTPQQVPGSPSPYTDIFNTNQLESSLGPEGFKKWENFKEHSVAFVMHRGHCANLLITKLQNLGVKNIVLVSTKEECDAEKRLGDHQKIIVDSFTDIASNFDKMGNYCKEHDIKQCLPFVGWGYQSESPLIPEHCAIQNKKLGSQCDFLCPSNSEQTLGMIADKDKFDQFMAQHNLPGIPNYGVTFGKDFDNTADQAITFSENLFAKYPTKHSLQLYFKHPKTGGGKGIRPITFSRADMASKFKDQVQEIDKAIQECLDEGRATTGIDKDFPLVIQLGIEKAQHFEVQGIGTEVVGIRECSAQENGQKKAEKTPTPDELPEHVRQKLYDQAKKFVDAADCKGLNTVEFLYDGHEAYFLECNPRMQVEHSVTESERQISIPGALICHVLGVDIQGLYNNAPSNYVQHIRLTSAANGRVPTILSKQEDIQKKMDKEFGPGVVNGYIQQNSIFNTQEDAQFGALTITQKDPNPQLALDVFNDFEQIFESQHMAVPFRQQREVLQRFCDGGTFRVGEEIDFSPVSKAEQERSELAQILAYGLNPEQKRKGEGDPLSTTEFNALMQQLEELASKLTEGPESKKMDHLSKLGWDGYWKHQDKVNYSFEVRDWFQSFYGHTTHHELSKKIQKVLNHMPDSVSFLELLGISGAGPQVLSVLLDADPEASRFKTAIPGNGLERGVYMNALKEATPDDRALMKYLLNKIESKQYGRFEFEGKFYSAYVVKDFDASNDPELNTNMVFENLVYGRPAYQTLSWNPDMKIDQIEEYIDKQFETFRDLADKHPTSRITRPLGYYIKCPSTSNAINADIINKIMGCIQRKYLEHFGKEIPNIALHMHNLSDGTEKDHQTNVALDVQKAFKTDLSLTRLTISGTLPVGGLGASHPDISQLDSHKDWLQETAFMDTCHKLMAPYDQSEYATPEEPAFIGPGGMATTASAQLQGLRNDEPDNKVVQALTYESALKLGHDLVGLGTLVTPNSQYCFTIGIEVAKKYGVVGTDGRLNIEKTKNKFLKDLNKNKTNCIFPEEIKQALASYNSFFKNPQEETLGKLLKVLKIQPKKKDATPVILAVDTLECMLQHKKDSLSKLLSFQFTDEEVLTALRYGDDAPSLLQKSRFGGDASLMSLESFLTRKDYEVGDIILCSNGKRFQLKSIDTIVTSSSTMYTLEDIDTLDVKLVSIENAKLKEEWMTEMLADLKDATNDLCSFSFEPIINSKISMDGFIPHGSKIRVDEEGNFFLSETGELLKFMMKTSANKMTNTCEFPELEEGEYIINYAHCLIPETPKFTIPTEAYKDKEAICFHKV